MKEFWTYLRARRRVFLCGALCVLIFTASAVVILFAMVVPQLAESAVRLTKAAPQLWQCRRRCSGSLCAHQRSN